MGINDKKFITLEKEFEKYFQVVTEIKNSGIIEGEDEETQVDYDRYDELNEQREKIINKIKFIINNG